MSFLPALASAVLPMLFHQNAGTTAGNVGNAAVGLLNAQSEADNVALMNENVRHQSAMQWEATWFNEMMDEKSDHLYRLLSLALNSAQPWVVATLAGIQGDRLTPIPLAALGSA